MNRAKTTASVDRKAPAREPQRWLLTAVALACLVAAIVLRSQFGTTMTMFVSAALFRISLVLGAISLAWDSLRKPARWLAPGMAAACLVGLAIMAAQPRLVLVIAPLAGVVLTAGAVMRSMRRG